MSVLILASLLVAVGELLPGIRDVNATTREAKVAWFTENCFGRRVVENPPYLTFAQEGPDRIMLGGAAIRKQARITYGGEFGTNSFVVTAFIPTAAKQPVPGFLHVSIRHPYSEFCDPDRRKKDPYHPVELIVERGYAAIAFSNWEIAPDTDGAANREGVFACFEAPSRNRDRKLWGSISAWAWGASRVMDWLETVREIDAKRIAIVGHSRGGKTALWTAVTDERFAMACVNGSGCAGAKLNRMKVEKAESIAEIVRTFQFWFCLDYTLCCNRDAELEFDQHELLACVAPRLLAVGSGSEDEWAGPAAEKKATELASAAWKDRRRVSYHCHNGPHDLGIADWNAYMDHADRFWKDK